MSLAAANTKYEVSAIDFALFSPQEVRDLAVVKITEFKLDIADRHNDNIQSLYARSMGPVQNKVECPTCKLRSPDCPGHFGYIEFPKTGSKQLMIIHTGFLDKIMQLLRSVCMHCSTPLLSANEIKRLGLLQLQGAKRLKAIAKLSLTRDHCGGADGNVKCHQSNPIFHYKEKSNYVRYHSRDEKNTPIEQMQILSPNQIRSIFELITPEHRELLGFARGIDPANMILVNLLVLPTNARPPRVTGDQYTHSDFTTMYSNIVRECEAHQRAVKPDDKREREHRIFALVSQLFNNSKGKHTYDNGRPLRTCKCMFTGKAGLIRGYTQGKRVDFCARSVASPNPNIRLSQVGIPRYLAEQVTFPEIVTVDNIKRLQGYMDRGLITNVTPNSGKMKGKVLGVAKLEDKQLQLGYVVDRYLMGRRTESDPDSQRQVEFLGDPVIVNRQPTLHKMSMMGMETVIVPDNTVQMPVNAAAPLGLDFDGDELNIHVPQTPQAVAEVRGQMSLTQCIVSAQHNRPVMGATQDLLTGLYLLTKPDVFVSREDFNRYVGLAYKDSSVSDLTQRIADFMRRVTKKRRSDFNDRINAAIRHALSELEHPQSRTRADYTNRARTVVLTRRQRFQFIQQSRYTQAERRIFNGQVQQPQRLAELEAEYQDWARDRELTGAVDDDDLQQAIQQLVAADVRQQYYVSGRELFSFVLPADMFYRKTNEVDPLEPTVVIEEGILVAGTVDKAIAGATHNSIVQHLFKLYSPEHAEDFLSRIKWLVDPWLGMQGFSLDLGDCTTTDPSFADLVNSQVRAARLKVWSAGPRATNPIEEMRRQEIIRSTLCNVKNATGELAMQRISSGNRIAAMVQSGSKGNMANFASIMTLIGQQEWQGRSIQAGPGGRSLPCFEANSRDPAAGGFVESDYVQGMRPHEVFLHQLAARDGLLGTATKTAETGYIQRRIVKALEDAVVYPDGSVRNAQGVVIQYAYGEDGFAGEKLVLSEKRSRFIDIKSLVRMIKQRRQAGLSPRYQPHVPSQVKYVMPSFDDDRFEEIERDDDDKDKEGDKDDDEEEEEEDYFRDYNDEGDDGGGDDDDY